MAYANSNIKNNGMSIKFKVSVWSFN